MKCCIFYRPINTINKNIYICFVFFRHVFSCCVHVHVKLNAAFTLCPSVLLCPLDGAHYQFHFMRVSLSPVRLRLRDISSTKLMYSHRAVRICGTR